MSSENLNRFFETVATDSALAAKVNALSDQEPAIAARQLASLSAEIGYPVSTEEFESRLSFEGELTDTQLESVAGGTSTPPPFGPEFFVSQISPFGCTRK